MLKIGNQLVSAKEITRTRSLSPFVQEVKAALEEAPFVYVSHKAWREQAGELTKASEKNGPRFTLKRHGIDCKAITLSGVDLEAVSESEGNELSETDVIYAMKKSEE